MFGSSPLRTLVRAGVNLDEAVELLQRLLQDSPKTRAELVKAIAERWRPHRTLACLYLWRSLAAATLLLCGLVLTKREGLLLGAVLVAAALLAGPGADLEWLIGYDAPALERLVRLLQGAQGEVDTASKVADLAMCLEYISAD